MKQKKEKATPKPKGGKRTGIKAPANRPRLYNETTELRRLPVSMLDEIDAELERRKAIVEACRSGISST